MKGVIFSVFPDICQEEIERLISKKAVIKGSKCIIEDTNAQELVTLCYHVQSAHRVGIYLDEQKEITKPHLSTEMRSIISNAKTFAVEVEKNENEVLPSMELAGEWGAVLKESLQLQVDLTNPDIRIFIEQDKDSFMLSVDLIGFDLSKRPYKIFNNPTSLNGIVAFALCAYTNLTPKSVLIDPFCGSGVIPIEAALFQQKRSAFVFEQRFSMLRLPFFDEACKKICQSNNNKKEEKQNTIFGYDDQLRIILGAKKNAKIAGVSGNITFSKVGIDWIDTKFEEASVDHIITCPPEESKKRPGKKNAKESVDELFYQSKHILKKEGTVNVLVQYSESLKEIAEKHGFSLIKERSIRQGKQSRLFLSFQKQQS